MRHDGAGRKNWLLESYEGTKKWFEDQTMHGLYVDKLDLYLEWRSRLDALMESLELKQNSGLQLSLDEKKKYNAGLKCIESLSEHNKRHAKNQQYRYEYLMRLVDCKLLVPQRLVALSPSGEMKRAEATWRCMDRHEYK